MRPIVSTQAPVRPVPNQIFGSAAGGTNSLLALPDMSTCAVARSEDHGTCAPRPHGLRTPPSPPLAATSGLVRTEFADRNGGALCHLRGEVKHV